METGTVGPGGAGKLCTVCGSADPGCWLIGKLRDNDQQYAILPQYAMLRFDPATVQSTT